MSESAATTLNLPEQKPRTRIPLRRRLIYISLIYVVFLLLLCGIEILTRFTMTPVSSLDLFVSTPQQRMQVADPAQAGIFEGDPLLLWRLKPNLNHVVWDFTVLSTNSQHFRADYPIVEKPAGTFRVICLGDSVTFGYRVPAVWPDSPTEYDHESLPFPMLLEKHLRSVNPGRKIEVFPMAVPGYTSHQGLAWLQRDINQLQPDMVIASFGWNDASFSNVADREAIRMDFYPVAVRWLIDHSQAFAHATQWLRSRNPTSQGQTHPVPRVSQLEYLNNFSRIVDLVRSRGAVIVVVAAPYRDAATNPPEAELMKQYRATLRANMKEQKVPYLEVLELTEAASPANGGFFDELIHPNNMGHRLLASELLKLMERERLLGDLNVAGFEP